MSIDDAVKKALQATPRGEEFSEQLERNRHFSNRMERAGVVTKKQEYSIPLMERIAHSAVR